MRPPPRPVPPPLMRVSRLRVIQFTRKGRSQARKLCMEPHDPHYHCTLTSPLSKRVRHIVSSMCHGNSWDLPADTIPEYEFVNDLFGRTDDPNATRPTKEGWFA